MTHCSPVPPAVATTGSAESRLALRMRARAIRLLGHTKLESTARYLGIEVEDFQHFRASRPLTGTSIADRRESVPPQRAPDDDEHFYAEPDQSGAHGSFRSIAALFGCPSVSDRGKERFFSSRL